MAEEKIKGGEESVVFLILVNSNIVRWDWKSMERNLTQRIVSFMMVFKFWNSSGEWEYCIDRAEYRCFDTELLRSDYFQTACNRKSVRLWARLCGDSRDGSSENSHLKIWYLFLPPLFQAWLKRIFYSFRYTYLKLSPRNRPKVKWKLDSRIINKYAARQIERDLGFSFAEIHKKLENAIANFFSRLLSIHIELYLEGRNEGKMAKFTYRYIFIQSPFFHLGYACSSLSIWLLQRYLCRAKEVGVRKAMGSPRTKSHHEFRWSNCSTL